MSNVFVNESTMTNIGNAIRSKTGKVDMILPQDMPSEIEGIKAEGTDLANSIINGTVTDICIDVPMRSYAFYECKNIKNPTFGDNCTEITYCAFQYCSSITELNTNKVIRINTYAFDGAKKLTKADLPNVIGISNYAFYSTNLETLILRCNKMCTLDGTRTFYNTQIEKGTGYIYVPKALIEQYKVATNWVTFANQFRSIEDYPELGVTN